MRIIIKSFALGAALSVSMAMFGQELSFRKLDLRGASATVPKGINALGDVVGLTVDGDGNSHGFLFRRGKFTTIDVPGATFTNAVGINARGDVVGRWSDTSGTNHGYLLSGGRFKTFDIKGCDTDTTPHGVNNAGVIVGRCVDAAGSTHGFELSGETVTIFDVPGSVLTDAYKSTDEGDIVGFYNDANDPGGAYLRTALGRFRRISVPDGTNVGARGINERESIVGQFDGVRDGQTHGFLLKNHQYTTIDFPGAAFTVVSDINNREMVVGDYLDDAGNDHGFTAQFRGDQ